MEGLDWRLPGRKGTRGGGGGAPLGSPNERGDSRAESRAARTETHELVVPRSMPMEVPEASAAIVLVHGGLEQKLGSWLRVVVGAPAVEKGQEASLEAL